MKTSSDLSIRLARTGDAPVLERLAALDSTTVPEGDVLLAETGGRAVAALALDEDRAFADPFVPSSEAVTVLRVRARQMSGHKQPRRSVRRRLGIHALAR